MNLADAFIQRYNTYNAIYALIYFFKSAYTLKNAGLF